MLDESIEDAIMVTLFVMKVGIVVGMFLAFSTAGILVYRVWMSAMTRLLVEKAEFARKKEPTEAAAPVVTPDEGEPAKIEEIRTELDELFDLYMLDVCDRRFIDIIQTLISDDHLLELITSYREVCERLIRKSINSRGFVALGRLLDRHSAKVAKIKANEDKVRGTGASIIGAIIDEMRGKWAKTFNSGVDELRKRHAATVNAK